jgi:FlaA1/EpsC-like NDP-sugar epimerase
MLTKTWRSLVLILGETLLLVAAVILGSYVRIGDETWVLLSDADGILRVALIVVVCQVCLHYADLYDLRGIKDTRDLLVRLFQALGATSLILAGAYFWFPDWIIGRGVFVVSALTAITFVVSWRLVFRQLTKRAAPRERLLLVGTSQGAVELARTLSLPGLVLR